MRRWICTSQQGCSDSDASPPPDSPSAPVSVTVRHLKANSAVVSWDVLEDEVVIGFAISQQKKDVRMLRFIQEVNTTTRSCALWDLEEDTEYIVHVQAISIQGQSPASEPVLFKAREAEKMASKNKGRPRPPSARDGVWGGWSRLEGCMADRKHKTAPIPPQGPAT
uniref:Fibronectin type III domain containing 5 n=1 Tax=Bos mutus grunniens TaxID=30521 RepID=A0A8B9XKG1_BOSMU